MHARVASRMATEPAGRLAYAGGLTLLAALARLSVVELYRRKDLIVVFLLLAAYFFGRSSDRLYGWLIRSRWLGDYIRHYREGTGITRRKKIQTLVPLWLSLGLTAVFVMNTWWGRGLLLAVAVGVSVHILTIRTAVEEPAGSLQTGCLPGEECP